MGPLRRYQRLVGAEGLPIALKLRAGQAHDGRSAQDMLASVGAGNIPLADRAYDSAAGMSGTPLPKGASRSKEVHHERHSCGRSRR